MVYTGLFADQGRRRIASGSFCLRDCLSFDQGASQGLDVVLNSVATKITVRVFVRTLLPYRYIQVWLFISQLALCCCPMCVVVLRQLWLLGRASILCLFMSLQLHGLKCGTLLRVCLAQLLGGTLDGGFGRGGRHSIRRATPLVDLDLHPRFRPVVAYELAPVDERVSPPAESAIDPYAVHPSEPVVVDPDDPYGFVFDWRKYSDRSVRLPPGDPYAALQGPLSKYISSRIVTSKPVELKHHWVRLQDVAGTRVARLALPSPLRRGVRAERALLM